MIDTEDVNESTGDVTVSIYAADYDSYILYYSYSWDGGETYSQLPWGFGVAAVFSAAASFFSVKEFSVGRNPFKGTALKEETKRKKIAAKENSKAR